ncbi:High-affinity proline transporter PutP [bioreactor metagenome]|uniref:High-affinity proline transporter PutP n=1 Tax=bioreactor metagenome TaxID=1076179 RepID=A0A644VRV4_9ZZZZ|nr:sodium/proline symporter PutP [Acidaminococcaceae bacterium]
MQIETGSIIALVLYFFILVVIGLVNYKSKEDLEGYVLGGRKLGPWVTSMSAEASDMSGWMLMGLPGYAYLSGVSAFWIAIGLALGTWANWSFIAKRLRIFTQVANNSITLPEYFENRFMDKAKKIRLVSSIFIFIFFLIYTSASFVAGGKLFNTAFGLDYQWSLLLTAGIVVFYTLVGGFAAVCWSDFFQGGLMFFSVLIVPITAIYYIGGIGQTISRLTVINPNYFNMFTDATGSNLSIIGIISLLAWGLGYFGQPHILVRFMAISSPKDIKQATKIAMTWVVISLFAAVMVGLVGRVYLGDVLIGTQSETVFMRMSSDFYSSFLAGIITSGILGAIMSTSSSQLLVASSSITTDFYKTLLRQNATVSELVIVSRLMVVVVAGLSLLLALNPDSMILEIVSYAWAGFGAAFGPLVIISLFWRKMTLNGALAGVIAGGITVLLWKNFMGFTGLYEIVPGFIFSTIAIYVGSLMSKNPSQEVTSKFDEAKFLYTTEENK